MSEDTFHLGIKAIIRDKNGKILLNRKINGKYWDLPGGRIHRQENPNQALERELKEEIGVSILKSMTQFSMVLSNLRLTTQDGEVGLILSVNLCEIADLENIQAKEEGTEIGWFDPKEAAKLLVFKYPREFLEKITAL